MKIETTTFVQLQGRELLKYETVTNVEYTEEEKTFLEAEKIVKGNNLYCNSYFGQDQWLILPESLLYNGRPNLQQYKEYAISHDTYEYDIVNMSDEELQGNDIIDKVIEY